MVLRRLIFDVEARRRVLVRSRGELIAISADRVGELFASQVLTGDMPPDSIVHYAKRVREMSDVWLQEIKRELALLEVRRGEPVPRDVLLQWNGAPGTWSMACEGRYPPVVQGTVDEVYMRRPPSRSRGLHVGLYRGRAFVTALNGTVIESTVSGQHRVEMPGDDFYPDVGTLVWDALVTEGSPAADGVEGTIVAGGALTYTGNDGRCTGRWHSP
ncbi:MAG TPA: hypothetical protein VJ788_08270 [Gemmatimonadota bacterium]|nr:hypothetical protein [Gemmatimonadota bacterium]